MGKSKKITIGFWYHLSAHFVVCKGPVDSVNRITYGERVAWEGSITSNQTLLIDQPGLHGGNKKEGGLYGNVTFMLGGQEQGLSPYLVEKHGAASPAYRGLTSLLFTGTGGELAPIAPEDEDDGESFLDQIRSIPFRGNKGFTWAALNRYFKSLWIDVTRRYSDWYGAPWYPERLAIGQYDMNPIHIIYQAITDPRFGAGISTADIDDSSFRAAADTLYTENFGMSLRWEEQMSVEDFIKYVLNHIHGSISPAPETGRLTMRLIRSGYDVNSLTTLGPEDCILDDFARAAWGDSVNEVTVKYLDYEENEQSVTVSDPASISVQGVVSYTSEYHGVRNRDLAVRLAQRDLNLYSQPLAKFTIRVNRRAYDFYVGRVFRLTYPARGIESVIVRVLEMDAGTLEDGYIRIEAVEDIFGMPSTSYAANPPTGFVPPSTTPQPVTTYKLVEASYTDIINLFSDSEIATFGEDFGYTLALGLAPSEDSTGFALYGSNVTTLANYLWRGQGDFCPYATLASAITADQTTISLANGDRLSTLALRSYGYLGDELIELVNGYDTFATIRRGCQDTVPVAHQAGTQIFWYSGYWYGLDGTERVDNETVYYRYLTDSLGGQLAIGSAPARTITMANRYERPYPPGNLLINGNPYPATVTYLNGALGLTWAHRDRTQQIVSLVDHTQGSIGPEEWTSADGSRNRTFYRASIHNPNTGAMLSSYDTYATSADWPRHDIARAFGTSVATSGLTESLLGFTTILPGGCTAHRSEYYAPVGVTRGDISLAEGDPISGYGDVVRGPSITTGSRYFEVGCVRGTVTVLLGYAPDADKPIPGVYASISDYPFGMKTFQIGAVSLGQVLRVAVDMTQARYWVSTGDFTAGNVPGSSGGTSLADVAGVGGDQAALNAVQDYDPGEPLVILLRFNTLGDTAYLNTGNLPARFSAPAGFTWASGSGAVTLSPPTRYEVRVTSRLRRPNGVILDSWQSARHVILVPYTFSGSGGITSGGAATATLTNV